MKKIVHSLCNLSSLIINKDKKKTFMDPTDPNNSYLVNMSVITYHLSGLHRHPLLAMQVTQWKWVHLTVLLQFSPHQFLRFRHHPLHHVRLRPTNFSFVQTMSEAPSDHLYY